MTTPGVQSVERAFDLLEVLGEAGVPLSLADIAARTHLAAPTAHRLLKTLQARGVVNQGGNRDYSLGPTLIALGRQATPVLAELARPILAELEEISQETANLAVLEHDLIVYVAQVASRHQMRMFTEVGRQVLPHASGVGKAILSTLPEHHTRALLRRTGQAKYTETTITDENALIADLKAARARGFAIDDGEKEVGVRCVAVAIPGTNPPAAVSISGPAARMTETATAQCVEALRDAARILQAQLG